MTSWTRSTRSRARTCSRSPRPASTVRCRTPAHFARFAGEVAVIATKAPIDGRSKWTGKLAGMEGDDVLLEVDGIVEHIAITEIKRARLKGSIDFSS